MNDPLMLFDDNIVHDGLALAASHANIFACFFGQSCIWSRKPKSREPHLIIIDLTGGSLTSKTTKMVSFHFRKLTVAKRTHRVVFTNYLRRFYPHPSPWMLYFL
jgi:hypothetical protein